MAYDATGEGGIPLLPAGMNDNSPLDAEANFYLTRGVNSLSDLGLQRCNGKSLARKFASPVLGIEGGIKGYTWVETVDALYLFKGPVTADDGGGGGDDIMEDYILLRDKKSKGVNGGSFFNDGYYARDINDKVVDAGNFATLTGGDTIVLLAGTYRFCVSVPCYGAGNHKAVLANDDDSISYPGTSESTDATSPTTSRSVIKGNFVITGTKHFSINHACTVGRATTGMGIAANQDALYSGDDVEIYTIAEFWRLQE